MLFAISAKLYILAILLLFCHVLPAFFGDLLVPGNYLLSTLLVTLAPIHSQPGFYCFNNKNKSELNHGRHS